jgi:GT2 family glycosyltransferase
VSTAPPPAATVVIVTRNRVEELRRALESALRQSAPVEVLVVDDGSTDGTADAVAREFSAARVFRSDRSRGLVVQRNAAARLAAAPVLVSLDDDAYFASAHTVEQTLAELDHPRIAAVAIPYVETSRPGVVRQRTPDPTRALVAPVFRGTAYAVRRDVFTALGGYRETIFHQGEERDFCIRLLQAGYVTRLGSADPIVHDESPARDTERMDVFGRRNEILYAWHNDPLPFAPARMAVMTWRGLLLGLRERRLARMARGLALGYAACWSERRRRRPVSTAAFRLDRTLRRSGPRPLAEIEPLLSRRSGAAASR